MEWSGPAVSAPIPVIGITTTRERVDRAGWPGQQADLLTTRYARAVERAGGSPVLLPPAVSAASAAAATSRVDGIIIAGGIDVSPVRYGERPGPHVSEWDDARDASELAHLAAAEQCAIPVLGICRGMQLLSVFLGGRLHQHLPDVVFSTEHSGSPGSFSPVVVRSRPGTRMARIMDVPEALVMCHHHQGVAEHPGLVVGAVAVDGSVHALEAPGERFVLGVQWHPEIAFGHRVFTALVDAASRQVADGAVTDR